MKDTVHTFISFIVIIIGVIIISVSITRCDGRNRQPKIEYDTVYITDTITDVKLDTVRLVKTISVSVPIHDTLYRDSIRIDSIEAEISIYQYSFDTVIAETQINGLVSGFNVELDKLTAVNKRTTTTITKKPRTKRWGIGINAGYGLSTNGNQIYGSPYIGVGLTYNILVF